MLREFSNFHGGFVLQEKNTTNSKLCDELKCVKLKLSRSTAVTLHLRFP